MPHVTILVAGGLVGLALILQIVGLATTQWIKINVLDIESGLWKVCQSGHCEDLSPATDWLKACRAFGILGVVGMAASLISAAFVYFMSNQKIFFFTAPVTACLGGFCAIVEFAVYVGKSPGVGKEGVDLGYSFGLTVAACVLAILAAIFFFLGFKRRSSYVNI